MKRGITRITSILVVLIAFSASAIAQQSAAEKCGFQERQAGMQNTDPGYHQQISDMEKTLAKWIELHAEMTTGKGNVITIPTVVHVVYNTPSENISTLHIQALIDDINADFRHTNADTANTPFPFDTLAADMEIEFCLAKRDPQNYSTTGIVRRQTSVSSFGLNDDVKFTAYGGSDAWDVTKYFNIWICNLGAGLLGYGDFPQANLPSTYGAVIHYCSVDGSCPPFDINRTTTHEIGHCLSLYHIWGDDGGNCTGSDQVFDTPNQGSSSSGCPTFPKTDNCSGGFPGVMFMNYMDYTDDACMNMFTRGQKQRAHAAINTYLSSLTTSGGCQPVTGLDAGIHQIKNQQSFTCDTTFHLQAELRNFGGDTIYSVTINYSFDGGTAVPFSWTGVLLPGDIDLVDLGIHAFAPGQHQATVFTSNPNAGTDINPGNNSQSINFNLGYSGTATPFTEGFENAAFPPPGWTILNPDGAYTWERTTKAANGGVASVFMNNWNYAANGAVDEMIMQKIDLSAAQNPLLTFDIAYALFSNTGYSDTLQVWVSEDCGDTWQKVYHKYDLPLTTAGFVAHDFVPNATQWRKDSVDLSAFGGNTGLLIKFRHGSDYENNLYIDNINISSAINTGINPHGDEGMAVSPNPANRSVFVSLPNIDLLATIRVINIAGKIVREISSGENNFELDVTDLPQGVYCITVETENRISTTKLVISK